MTKSVNNSKIFNIASAEKYGATAKVEHVVDAVKMALKKAQLKNASSVLLFLTNGYNQNPKPALKAAAKAAGTIQVYGATAVGLLTHNEWIMDHEGAVAMVFPEDCDLQPANLLNSQNKLSESLPLLCLTSPEQSKIAINDSTWEQHPMFGAITSNAFGSNEYPIWQASRITKNGFVHANFNTPANKPLTAHTIVSQGVRRISSNLLIDESNDNCISQVSGQTPTLSLQQSIPDNMYSMLLEQPYHTLCAVSEAIHVDEDQQNAAKTGAVNALNKDFYRLFNIVGIDEERQSVFLSGKVKTRQCCFWALRDNAIAEQEWDHSLKQLAKSIQQPEFAILFCSESRGPYFHGGNDDTDLRLFKHYFPDTPLIGVYSSGEISAGAHYQSLLRRYSSVLTIYAS